MVVRLVVAVAMTACIIVAVGVRSSWRGGGPAAAAE